MIQQASSLKISALGEVLELLEGTTLRRRKGLLPPQNVSIMKTRTHALTRTDAQLQARADEGAGVVVAGGG